MLNFSGPVRVIRVTFILGFVTIRPFESNTMRATISRRRCLDSLWVDNMLLFEYCFIRY